MITYLKGEVVSVTDKKVVLDVNNVGFQIAVSPRDAQAMPPEGEIVRLHTYMSVKEDGISLFGFLSEDDLEMYRMLVTVSGIGPKGGLSILSVLTADDLRFAVLSDDAKAISAAPGVGLKTAKKLILELKDKLSLEDAVEKRMAKQNAGADSARETAKNEALQALVALGYSNSDALRAVREVEITEDMDTEAVLKAALKKLIGR